MISGNMTSLPLRLRTIAIDHLTAAARGMVVKHILKECHEIRSE